MNEDTIFALATGAGRAAIAVMRISGPRTAGVLQHLLGSLPPARRATYARLRAGLGGDILDRCLVLWFPGPASFTGEDSAEFHLHGGRAVIAGVAGALGRDLGCRPAWPGEFTRRAFLNGKLDLTEVEGLADLINAETQAQRVQALRQLGGALGRLAQDWRRQLIGALAAVEAEIDFSDESDVDVCVGRGAFAIATKVAAAIAAALNDGQRGERLRDGYVVVLAGPPNAGKSTLLNAIARREAAIVSPHAGTTRDAIEVQLELEGLPVTLIDTAGLRPTIDPIEKEGVARALDRASAADLVLLLRARGSAPAPPPPTQAAVLAVQTMADLPTDGIDREPLIVSALTGAGLDELVAAIAERARDAMGAGEAVITKERHRRAMVDALDSLRSLNDSLPVELVAEHLRRAAAALAALTGLIRPDDVLDEIFAQFCIGK
jgi:tRNA modification GTPase